MRKVSCCEFRKYGCIDASILVDSLNPLFVKYHILEDALMVLNLVLRLTASAKK